MLSSSCLRLDCLPCYSSSMTHRHHHRPRRISMSFNRTATYLSDELRLDPDRALALNPALRTHPLASLQHSHALLLSAGLSPPQISRVFTLQPLLLTHPFAYSLRFLAALFPPSPSPSPSPPPVATAISLCPFLLACPVSSQLSPALLFLRRFSVPVTPATSILLALSVDSTLYPKLHFLLRSLPGGDLSLPRVKYILSRFPRLLTYSIHNNLLPKALYLHHDMRLHVPTEIFAFPQYFAYNLHTRIKHRHRLLLLSDGPHITRTLSLQEMLTPSDHNFYHIILDRKLQFLHRIATPTHQT